MENTPIKTMHELLLSKKWISDTRLLYCGILVAFSAACYIQTLQFGFLLIDDSLYVTGNAHVREGLSKETIKWAFSTIDAEFWHPLTWISLLIDSTLYNMSARGFHSSNLILHLSAGIFLFLSFDLMTGQRGRSFILAALFAVHPLHVETVAWIAERKEVLCGFFWCAALFAYAVYVKKPGIIRYLAVLVLFCLGLMSKPMIVTFPFVILLLDLWPLKRHAEGIPGSLLHGRILYYRAIMLIMEKLPLFVLTVIASGLAIYAQQEGAGIVAHDVYPFTARVSNAIVSYKSYLLKTIFPTNLSIFYPLRMDISTVKVMASASLLFIISCIAVIRLKKQPYLFTGWFWFIGTLVPVIGIVKIGDFAMADRYMYMPIVGILIAIIWLGADLFDHPSISKTFPVVLAAVVILFGATGTWKYLGEWKNDETLFQHAATTAAPNYFAHFALGHVYAGKGYYQQAEQQFDKAVSLQPEKMKLRIDLGRAIGAQGRFSDAMPHFKAVLAKKNNAEANFYMGLALAGTEQISAALDHFEEAIKDKNSDMQETLNLQRQLEMLHVNGELQKALELLGINSKDSVAKMFTAGYDTWRT